MAPPPLTRLEKAASKKSSSSSSPSSSSSSSSASSQRTLRNDQDDSSHNIPAATESTPLLLSKSSSSSSSSPTTCSPPPSNNALEDGIPILSKEKPFPTTQILLLCFARLMEPIAFFAVFPFIAQMVKRNADLADSDIGFYSGLIESLFSAVQVLVLIFWGRLADSIGRKPVILVSLAGMTAGTMGYTAATTLPAMILWRCVAGLFSGSNLVLRTAISDHCSHQTQALAFSWFSFAGNIGIFVGPILGGALADPVEQYPALFGDSAFFAAYPYALVGFALTAVSTVGIVVSALFLDETLPSAKKKKKEEGAGAASGAGAGAGAGAAVDGDGGRLLPLLDEHEHEPGSTSTSTSTSEAARAATALVAGAARPSIRDLLRAPGVAVVIWVYTHFLLLAFAFTAILPVALYTPISIGGTGFDPLGISLYMALQGFSQALWLLLVFPWAVRRLGTNGVLRACADAYPFFFASFVLLNLLLRVGTPSANAWAWVVGLVSAVVGPGVSMAFTGVQLAVNDVSPNAYVMGTLNAVAMTSASAIRSFVPGVATAVYAVGVRNQVLGGHLAWCLLIPISMSLRVVLRYMPGERLAGLRG